MRRKIISSYSFDKSVRNLWFFMILCFGAFLISVVRSVLITYFWVQMLVLVIISLLLWLIIHSTQSRINLYEEGIELERGNSKLFTSWENVYRFTKDGWGSSPHIFLQLYEPVKPEAKGFIEKLFFGKELDFVPIGEYVNIPTKWFSREFNLDKFLETDFGKQLFELAPHLFGVEEKTKNQLEDESENEQAIDEIAHNIEIKKA